jgi:signal peptidase I
MGNSSSNRKSNREERRAHVGIRQWIYGILACLCCIAFVVWTGYYILLLLIPVFIDIYITKFINWSGWKDVKNKQLRTVLDWVDAILFALVGVYFITTFFFQNYQIPTSSLEKSLLVGDFLCVSKMSYGTRSPMTPFSLPLVQHTIPGINTKSYLEKPQVDYQRFKSGGEVKRYDIVVFNYPSGDTIAMNAQNDDYYRLCAYEGRQNVQNNKAKYGNIMYRPVDRRENYVKRCVGLPGETISMIDDTVFIDGKSLPDPENMQLQYCVQTTDLISEMVFDELGISKEDQKSSSYVPIKDFDSTRCEALGLKYIKDENQDVYLYDGVYLTKEMIEKLEKKPFVQTIVKRNLLYKRLNELEPQRQLRQLYIYPEWFGFNRHTEYGDYPATWIPKRGETITFDADVDYKVAAYRRCIENYELNKLDYRDGKVYINGEQADSYTFKFDYFFMMGDNRDNSLDSRAWGFVPENHIVGKPMFIWLSLDKDKGWFSGKIRWDRIFTSGNKNK